MLRREIGASARPLLSTDFMDSVRSWPGSPWTMILRHEQTITQPKLSPHQFLLSRIAKIRGLTWECRTFGHQTSGRTTSRCRLQRSLA
jgi:hypothetical protein